VVDNTTVKFRDNITSLSNAADTILREMGYDWQGVRGPLWWSFNGKKLEDLRFEKES